MALDEGCPKADPHPGSRATLCWPI